MTGVQLIKRLRTLGLSNLVFRFPYVHAILTSEEFGGLGDSEREALLAQKLNVSMDELRRSSKNNLLTIHTVTPQEAARDFSQESYSRRGYHWLTAFAQDALSPDTSANGERPTVPFKVIHFYGYKGGQARSTLLGLLAHALAEDGWRVLAVDADLEAPSLDVIFSRNPRQLRQTLMGLIQEGGQVTPERIPAPSGPGFVDLLACRPQSAEFDVDAVALTLRAALDPTDIEKAARRISQLAIEARHDIVLVDHRSGLSHTTLPWMATLPGPSVICIRLDEQWRPAAHSIQAVLNMNPTDPGIFVSWKPDDELEETYRQRNYGQISELLSMLADVTSKAGEYSEAELGQLELTFTELEDHWVIWPYDPAFRQIRIPDKKALSGLVIDAIGKIRSLLDVSDRKLSKEVARTTPLSPSGGVDTGDLIQTDAIRQLKTAGNSFSYIFGRKGTGKTRLLRVLAEAALGEPLIIDPNSNLGSGIKSASPELVQAASRFQDEPIALWWKLLSAALDNTDTSREFLSASFLKQIHVKDGLDPVSEVLAKCAGSERRVFLLDGLETAFTSDRVFLFIESLFRFLQIAESDDRISNKIQFKLFLRTDLARRGFQNIEQQLHGRSIYLSWDTQKIFNFVLSRIARIDWFQNSFPHLVAEIYGKIPSVIDGELSVTECENLLMQAFPPKLRRNNLATKTFLKTYFADTASDRTEASTSDKLRYYPRIFDKFLEVIANPRATDAASFSGARVERDGKISQGLIFFAHDVATSDYLEQLRSELNYLISFDEDPNRNADKIRSLLAAFDGLKTPFRIDEHVRKLADRTDIAQNDIRTAMQRMWSMGLFEDRPGYAEEWRVGRLFKSALRMKYVRA